MVPPPILSIVESLEGRLCRIAPVCRELLLHPIDDASVRRLIDAVPQVPVSRGPAVQYP